MVKKIIGKKLKATRLRNDMTIQGLAECSGVSSNMISRIERGLTTPSVEIIVKLANAFGMSINYFVEEAEKGSTIIHTRQGEQIVIRCPIMDFIDRDLDHIAGRGRFDRLQGVVAASLAQPASRQNARSLGCLSSAKLELIIDLPFRFYVSDHVTASWRSTRFVSKKSNNLHYDFDMLNVGIGLDTRKVD
ncbi:MAG: helix-turn-helix transcriptional regulator [Desulfuromonadales bacterium]